jgi:hypothetical protein
LDDRGRALTGGLRSLRCVRCGGSVYLEEIDPRRGRDVFDIPIPPPRRGGPPKRHLLAS